ncbi:hypothetical protein FPZ12_010045 [Amycolatopsis acidicola]|uniref:Amidohydrolase family protein n=1 Tax=Amycolatopsis acidicola TaxID=2596893 RepID=A0A5N0VBA2_9PSEU|nr:DUF6282 family protein [Amycolatopsis acidicola]KAA9163325.1 hypothetical protein FPZ12_010045 [Amycolatopsis acidicola]
MVDDVLRGAVDMHVHGYPDASPQWPMRTDDETLVSAARDCGMRGLVLKSHFWPTMDRARRLTETLADPGFTVFGSITLNPLIGGLQPATVEAAAGHGAKVVFMPTWGSANDARHRGFVREKIVDRWFPRLSADLADSAITVLDGSGRLRGEAREIVSIAQEQGMVVSTGHLGVAESVALAEYSAEIGFRGLVFCHPFSSSVDADLGAMKTVVGLGGAVEMTAVHAFLPTSPVTPVQVYEAIRELGAGNVVLSSDVFFDWMPSHAEMLRCFTGQLRMLGLSQAELRTMLAGTPRRLLGLGQAESIA